MLEFVDSHCHINFPEFSQRLPAVLRNAEEKNVKYMLCVSVDLESYPQVIGLAQQHTHVWASVGVHPNARDVEEPSIERLIELAKDEKVIAIGETGLDYYRSEGDLTWQHKRFRNHIEAAVQCSKPLIIHTRESSVDTVKMLKEGGAEQAGGVMHCFTESWEVAKQALDLGFYISLSGIVTFKNAIALKEVARQVPLDRLLIETDSPYLAPVPHRGKTNEPAYVCHVAEHIAELRGVGLEELAAATTNNFFTLFSEAAR